MMKNKNLLISVLLGLLLFSCVTTRTNSYETFYLGEKGIQYFVKPIKFKGTKSNKLLADFTFLHVRKTKLKDSITVNFSIIFKNTNNLGEIEKVIFDDIDSNVKVLFEEDKKIRLTTKISKNNFRNFLNSAEKEITVKGEKSKEKYIPNSSAKKKLDKIKSVFKP